MRVIIAIFIFLAIPAVCFSATLTVPGMYPTIQAAIDLAVDGDTVLVDDGTYVENIDFLGKAIIVTSVNGADVTVIDGGNPVYPDWGSVVTFISGEGPDSVLDGFTITNGTGAKIYLDYRYGGGIHCDGTSPTLCNNVITENQASYGGGIYGRIGASPVIIGSKITHNSVTSEGAGMIFVIDCSPTVSDNIVADNSAELYGGGMEFWSNCAPTITDNDVQGNTVVQSGGGGILIGSDCSGTIENNFISENTSDGSTWSGGGILVDNNCDTLIKNNTILNNTTNKGGGIHCMNSYPTISHNLIAANTADNGGGISCTGDAAPDIIGNIIIGNTSNYTGGGIHCATATSANISNNILSENTASTIGGGIYVHQSSPVLINNSFLGNSGVTSGGGLYYFGSGSAPLIKNSILWNNVSPSGPAISLGSGVVLTISHSDVEGGKSSVFISFGATLNWGAGMIDADPLFVDAAGGDFHIRHHSPCCDTGDNSVPGLPAEDFEGDPRICYGTVDMGADEHFRHLYAMGDFTPGGSMKVNLTGLPNTYPVGLIVGFNVYDPPLHSMWGDWYVMFPWVGPIPLGPMPSPDGVLTIKGLLPGSPPGPYNVYMQAIIGDKLTNLFTMNVE